MKKLATAILVFFSIASAAQAADVNAGKEKSMVCAGCHGADGNSVVPTFPKVAGQHASYLTKQLVDFKSGNRVDPIMAGQVAALSEQDMDNLSAFYASQKVVKASGKSEAGMKLYEGGNLESGVAACKGCHGPSGDGMQEARFPALAGQHSVYLQKQLQAFRNGSRKNDLNGMMQDVASKMTDAEIQAVSEYISGM